MFVKRTFIGNLHDGLRPPKGLFLRLTMTIIFYISDESFIQLNVEANFTGGL